jgi:hypothetical protein
MRIVRLLMSASSIFRCDLADDAVDDDPWAVRNAFTAASVGDPW